MIDDTPYQDSVLLRDSNNLTISVLREIQSRVNVNPNRWYVRRVRATVPSTCVGEAWLVVTTLDHEHAVPVVCVPAPLADLRALRVNGSVVRPGLLSITLAIANDGQTVTMSQSRTDVCYLVAVGVITDEDVRGLHRG